MLQLLLLEKLKKRSEGQLTFFANPKYEEFLYSTKASIIIINEAYELKQPVNATLDPCSGCLYCFCHTA